MFFGQSGKDSTLVSKEGGASPQNKRTVSLYSRKVGLYVDFAHIAHFTPSILGHRSNN